MIVLFLFFSYISLYSFKLLHNLKNDCCREFSILVIISSQNYINIFYTYAYVGEQLKVFWCPGMGIKVSDVLGSRAKNKTYKPLCIFWERKEIRCSPRTVSNLDCWTTTLDLKTLLLVTCFLGYFYPVVCLKYLIN